MTLVSTTPRTTGLKVLKQYVYADVTLGDTGDQGRVTTTVRVAVTDPEVAAAMKPLLDLLAKRAYGAVREADQDQRIYDAARERVRTEVKAEKERIHRDNNAALSEAYREITTRTADLSDQQRPVYVARTALERAATALRGLTGKD